VKPTDLPFLMTEAEVATHQRLKPHTLRNARYRGEGLPHVRTPTGSIRYRLEDVMAWNKTGLQGFTYEGLAGVLAKCKGLDGRQRTEVMEAVRLWLRPSRQ